MPRYTPAEIEPRWQQHWENESTFATPDLPGDKKLYVLDMFPYPSGEGLHVGHPEGYTATDIVARYNRMRGVTVLHPIGFDAFGLPAEEHAIKTGTPPQVQTQKNIDNFTRQLKMLGFSYDWDRVVATTDPDYFRWTQWIFLQLFDTWFDHEQQRGRPIAELPIPAEVAQAGNDAVRKYQDEHRLAYQDDALVNWCPALGTVLANEEVVDGKSERGDHPVQRIPLRQWMLRITAYAERLLSDLETVDWPAGIKKLQRDWIGRSTGAEVDFFIGDPAEFDHWKADRAESGWSSKPSDDALRVYTTRPDTLFGATYMVVSPEHRLLDTLIRPEQEQEVRAYCEAASFKSDRERTEGDRVKTGVFTGSYAVNPVNGTPVPIWVADYVLASYGTGAIMAVPAHDTRDHEFAVKFDLPIITVVLPPKGAEVEGCFTGEGTATASDRFDGKATTVVKREITEMLAEQGLARAAVNFKLRDWLFSRQRFWGEPFPILHELDDEGNPTGRIRAVEESALPVTLPELDDYKPHGRPEPPLGKADDDWLIVERDGKRYRRETNTMPQWAGSCWYYLRYIDPKNDDALIDRKKEEAWMPVDLYVGGAEHAVLHLLYARFWHKVLYDRGHVRHSEPFQRLVNQGMILGEMEHVGYVDTDEKWVSAAEVQKNEQGGFVDGSGNEVHARPLSESEVEKRGEGFVVKADPKIQVESRSFKMSKSRGNVVNPDQIVRDYGADSLRLYEMFMGPLEATKPWSMSGVSGVRNFLDRVWRLIIDQDAESIEIVAAVSDDPPTAEQNRMTHATIKAVTEDLESMAFNTAIARMMELTNFLTRQQKRPRSSLETLVLLLAPFAPHLAEELWRILGHEKSLAYEPWPQFDPAALVEDEIELPIQVNGKVKAKIVVAKDADRDAIAAAALAEPKVKALVDGKTIVKQIVVPGKLVSLVVK